MGKDNRNRNRTVSTELVRVLANHAHDRVGENGGLSPVLRLPEVVVLRRRALDQGGRPDRVARHALALVLLRYAQRGQRHAELAHVVAA